MTEENKIKQIKIDWVNLLMSKGVIAKLTISRWSGSSRISSEDLGLKFIDEDTFNFTKKYITLGTQKLLPLEIIDGLLSIENKARLNLYNYSFKTCWGRFIPYQCVDAFETESEIIKNEYIEQGLQIGLKYDSIIEMVKKEYVNLAVDVWYRLYRDQGTPTESFIENFVSNIINKIPSREKIMASFKYNIVYSYIDMPAFLQQQIYDANEIKRQNDLQQFKTELEKVTQNKIAQNFIKRRNELMDDFLNSTIKNLRREIAEFSDIILLSINKRGNKSLTLTNINKIKKMVKKARYLNFYNDKEISDSIEILDKEVDRFKGDRDNDLVCEKLTSLSKIADEELNLERISPAIGFLEI